MLITSNRFDNGFNLNLISPFPRLLYKYNPRVYGTYTIANTLQQRLPAFSAPHI